jgi:hypothetical protein
VPAEPRNLPTSSILHSVRRLAGILFTVLLFHPLLGVEDLACASRMEQTAQDGQTAHDAGAMQMNGAADMAANATARDHGDSQSHGPTHTSHQCCTSAASWGAVYVARVAAEAFVADFGKSDPVADLLTASSGPTGPETPPPRL